MTELSFPGLNIDAFPLNRVAFTIFGVNIYWYGVIITFGMLCAVAYAIYRAKQINVSFDTMTDMAIFTIVIGIIGARAYYVLTSLDEYHSIGEIFATRNGGLAIYGGIIAGALTILVFCLIKKINWLSMFDCIAPGVMLAQAIGRWGNFVNVEAYGSVTTLPWRMCSPSIANELLIGDFISVEQYGQVLNGTLGVHPTFFYESLWNIIGFILINIFYKHKKFNGQIALSYFAWYGFGRMFIEGLRTDSLYVGPFRISQVVGFLCFVICTIIIIVVSVKLRKNSLKAGSLMNIANANVPASPSAESSLSSEVSTIKATHDTEKSEASYGTADVTNENNSSEQNITESQPNKEEKPNEKPGHPKENDDSNKNE